MATVVLNYVGSVIQLGIISLGLWCGVIAFRVARKSARGAQFWSILSMACMIFSVHAVIYIINLIHLFNILTFSADFFVDLYFMAHVAFIFQSALFAAAGYNAMTYFSNIQRGL